MVVSKLFAPVPMLWLVRLVIVSATSLYDSSHICPAIFSTRFGEIFPIVSKPSSISRRNTCSVVPSSRVLIYSVLLTGTSPIRVLIVVFRYPLCLYSALFLFSHISLSTSARNSDIIFLAISQPFSKILLSISLNVIVSDITLFISRSPVIVLSHN